jgi:hypothetical protein
VHVILLKLPPDLLAVQVTMPVGVPAVPGLLSVTVTVSIVTAPSVTETVLGLTEVPVARLFIVKEAVPELLACWLSPR